MPAQWAHRCERLANSLLALQTHVCTYVTREGGRAVREEALPVAKSWGTSRQAFAPSWQLDLTLELSSSVLFHFLFFGGVGFKLSCFVYITPKFCGTKDLQVQICPAFINFPSLFNLCDFNFPSLYC